jgi:hypothetical protein
MATSGAAANPTMGYHTKTAYAVLLALFNVRLGRWVGNPRVDAKWQRSSPGFALWYLIKEAFNSTSDEDGYLQLSDGGHFDNLGLYALVKRRCRYIVCCDAGADGDFKYEDLGNAIRKCRIDLGVDIQIDVSSLRPKEGEDGCRVPCAVGRILYRKENRVGTLVYIKPCKTMDMPSDVINYALMHSAFPHETTADQFFSESQFESYRGLGRHVALKVLGVSGATSVSKLFTKVQQRWYPTRESAAADFTRHAATLDDLFDRLSKDTKLSLLDKQFYPGWRAVFSESPAHRSEAFRIPLDDPDAFRSCFYFCNSLIQLMESVFIDLSFQEEKEYEHPDNRGWMNLFMHWSWSGMFRVTWTLSAATYGVRFQEFCEHVLGLRLGKLKLEQLGSAHWDATKDYHARPDIEQSPSADQSASKGLGGCFNFHEWEQITLMLGETFDETVAIYQLSLVLDIEVEGSAAIQLPVGYAVVENQQLRMYRVQDQLRKMGLGRNGLRELMECQSTLALSDKTRLCDDLILIGEADSPETSAEAVKRFDEMYDSVSHELLSTRLG